MQLNSMITPVRVTNACVYKTKLLDLYDIYSEKQLKDIKIILTI